MGPFDFHDGSCLKGHITCSSLTTFKRKFQTNPPFDWVLFWETNIAGWNIISIGFLHRLNPGPWIPASWEYRITLWHMGVEPKIVVFPPKWMVKIMEKNPIFQWMIWGENPPFLGNTHIPGETPAPPCSLGAMRCHGSVGDASQGFAGDRVTLKRWVFPWGP